VPCRDESGRDLLGWRSLLRHLRRLPPPALGRRAVVLHQRAHARAVARHLRSTGAQVVLAEFGWSGVAMTGACSAAGVPLVVHFHGSDAYVRRVLREHAVAYPAMFAQAAAIVAVSRDMERQLIELGAPPEKLHRIVYGIDLELFRGADPERAPPRFLAVGRFVEKKAPLLTLRAFATVAREEPSARLTMIGDGPLLEEARTAVLDLGLADRVELAGARPHAEIAAAMGGARVFVQHSVRASDGDCEGTPVSILEAQASGLPVVATRHAGIPDVVLEGETGALVDEGDVAGMADAMSRLVREPALAAAWGAAGRRRVAQHFTRAMSLASLAAVIEGARGGRLDGARGREPEVLPHLRR
jgi:glycosyltransferase involved in cell wall biosynthesis